MTNHQPKYQYKNIMEILVEQEVTRQMAKVPIQMLQYIRSVEVVTYALNRLPVMYACSEKGMQLQLKNAKKEFGPQIVQHVKWAMTAVQRDPLRQFKPVQQQDQRTLDELRKLFKDPSLSWQSLPDVVAGLLEDAVNSDLNTKETLDDSPTAPAAKKDMWRSKTQRKVNYSSQDFDWEQDMFVR
ncbi:late competence development ComFB family protein [Prochlorothrix hollandica]|uniref:late competence development ComFB family protein n=1 Tax=Prochlorothrix hollandica TaxID=1223 RepID=UPI00333E51A7